MTKHKEQEIETAVDDLLIRIDLAFVMILIPITLCIQTVKHLI